MSAHDRYDAAWYADQRVGSSASAAVVVPILMDLLAPNSVVDVGCGVGCWLEAFGRAGVTDRRGFDFSLPARATALVPEGVVEIRDLTRTITVDRRFDLALCLEVAEHLPIERAAELVRDLTRLADVVVFSAAVPGQGGNGHINEQWPSWWSRLFATEGFVTCDPIRPAVWSNDAVDYWYRQNCLVHIHAGRKDLLARIPPAPAHDLDRIHPVHHGILAERLKHPGLRLALREISTWPARKLRRGTADRD